VLSRPAITAALSRGVLRHLVQAGYAPLVEVPLPDGRRADVMALGPDGRITIVEIKSCPADYLTDRKWRAYAAYCDQFGFAVAADFPLDLLPEEPGILVADAYEAVQIRPFQTFLLAPARRRALHLRFGRLAALRVLGIAEALGEQVDASAG
jgi:hypothetical protein